MQDIEIIKKLLQVSFSFSLLLGLFIAFQKFYNYTNNNFNEYIIYNKNKNEYRFFNKKNFPNLKLCFKNQHICKENKILKNFEIYKIDMAYDRYNTKFYKLDNVMILNGKDKFKLIIFVFVLLIFGYMLVTIPVIDMEVSHIKLDKLILILYSTIVIPMGIFTAYSIKDSYVSIDYLVNKLERKNIINKKEIVNNILSLKNKKDFDKVYLCIKYNKNLNLPKEIIIKRNKIKN